jgi:Protein of unknown function (DUF3168)
MEIALRAALVAWLSADPGLTAQLNSITEEVPSRTSLPWLAIAASASADWSCKSNPGREVRIAVELHCRGDQADAAFDLAADIERRIEELPREQAGYLIVTAQFLRARSEQRGESSRVVLLEYRFRLLGE